LLTLDINLAPLTSYTFDISYQTFQDYYFYWDETPLGIQVLARINAVTPSSAQLRLTFMDHLPFPVSTLSGQSTIQIMFPQRRYTRIRVSWDNSFGIPTYIPLEKPLNTSISDTQNLNASFTIQVSSSILTKEYPMELMDYLIIFFLAMAVVLGLTGIAQWIRSFRTNRRDIFTLTVAPPIPELHAYDFISNGMIPISAEKISKDGKDIVARTFLVIMPRLGDHLPSMAFGTFMRVVDIDRGGKSADGSEDGILLLKIRQSRPLENA
jgi:hypothetical protein